MGNFGPISRPVTGGGGGGGPVGDNPDGSKTVASGSDPVLFHQGDVASAPNSSIVFDPNGEPAELPVDVASGLASYELAQGKVGKGDLVVNVEDYRASTDGSDTAVIQAALAILQTADGGTIYFPKNSYTVTQTIVPRRRFHFLGTSTGTVVKLADGANVDLVQTADFGTLTGGATQAGPDRFRLENLTLDGNGSNQTATSWTFRAYASNYSVQNVEFRNGRDGNVWSEWGTGGTNMEATWDNFKVVNNVGGQNMVWAGPHDSSFTNGYVFRDGTRATEIGDGITTQGNAGGEMFANVHVWGNHVNGWMLNKLAICSNCVSEGARDINVLVNSMRSVFTGTVYGRSSGTSANEVGVQIGTSGGSSISGYLVSVSSWQWNATTSIPFNFVNDGGGAIVSTVYKTTATNIRSGSMSVKSLSTLVCIDVPTQSISYTPRLVLNNASGGAIQVGNGTKDMMRLVTDGTNGVQQYPGSTSLRGYSDAYTTEKWRIDGGTGVITPGKAVTASRPTAATAGQGGMFFDTTLNKPIWSTGSAWVDATGTTV